MQTFSKRVCPDNFLSLHVYMHNPALASNAVTPLSTMKHDDTINANLYITTVVHDIPP